MTRSLRLPERVERATDRALCTLRACESNTNRSGSPPLYNGRPGSITATADVAEDPVDVYRVKVRAGRKLRLSLKPSVGDPDLFVFNSKARDVGASAVRVSSRSGTRTDRVTVRNRGRKTTTFYAAVGFNTRKQLKLLNASYVLRAR